MEARENLRPRPVRLARRRPDQSFADYCASQPPLCGQASWGPLLLAGAVVLGLIVFALRGWIG